MTAAADDFREPCPFCDKMHFGAPDEVEYQIMNICRKKASARKRGELSSYDPAELNRAATLTPERCAADNIK